jgi:hypothetical protein
MDRLGMQEQLLAGAVSAAKVKSPFNLLARPAHHGRAGKEHEYDWISRRTKAKR